MKTNLNFRLINVTDLLRTGKSYQSVGISFSHFCGSWFLCQRCVQRIRVPKTFRGCLRGRPLNCSPAHTRCNEAKRKKKQKWHSARGGGDDGGCPFFARIIFLPPGVRAQGGESVVFKCVGFLKNGGSAFSQLYASLSSHLFFLLLVVLFFRFSVSPSRTFISSFFLLSLCRLFSPLFLWIFRDMFLPLCFQLPHNFELFYFCFLPSAPLLSLRLSLPLSLLGPRHNKSHAQTLASLKVCLEGKGTIG